MSDCSERKRLANRLNALKSTGPKSAEGKARSSRNATTHGIFCRDVVLPGEDEDAFHLIREGLLESYNPQDFAELLLVDRIVAAAWKLRRLQSAEHEVFLGQQQRMREAAVRLTNLHVDYDPDDIKELPPSDREQPVSRRVRAMGERLRAALDAGQVSTDERWAGGRCDRDDPAEKLSRLEQRLESSMHRAMRGLERKQKERRRRAKELEAEAEENGYDLGEAPCPFAAEARATWHGFKTPADDVHGSDDGESPTRVENPCHEEPIERNEPTEGERQPPSPCTQGEGGGEGSAVLPPLPLGEGGGEGVCSAGTDSPENTPSP